MLPPIVPLTPLKPETGGGASAPLLGRLLHSGWYFGMVSQSFAPTPHGGAHVLFKLSPHCKHTASPLSTVHDNCFRGTDCCRHAGLPLSHRPGLPPHNQHVIGPKSFCLYLFGNERGPRHESESLVEVCKAEGLGNRVPTARRL